MTSFISSSRNVEWLITNISYIIPFMVALTAFLVGGAFAAYQFYRLMLKNLEAYLKPIVEQLNRIDKTLQDVDLETKINSESIMKDTAEKLRVLHEEIVKQGWASRDCPKCISFFSMYVPYEKRGGNGFAHKLKEDIENMMVDTAGFHAPRKRKSR